MPPKDLRIEYAELGSLLRWPRNPRDHDLGAIHASIKRFGYVSPIILDESTNRIVAGHGRLAALQQMKAAGQSPPPRIQEKVGLWYVPVIKGVVFENETEAGAYLISGNRTAELGSWNTPELTELLADLATKDVLDGTGFDNEDLDEIMRQLGVRRGKSKRRKEGEVCICPMCSHEHRKPKGDT